MTGEQQQAEKYSMRLTGGINWTWYECPIENKENAVKFADWLTEHGYNRVDHLQGWRDDNRHKYFVRYHH